MPSTLKECSFPHSCRGRRCSGGSSALRKKAMCLALAQPGSLRIQGMLPPHHIGWFSGQGCAQEPFSFSAETLEQALGFLVQAPLSFSLVLVLSDSFSEFQSLTLTPPNVRDPPLVAHQQMQCPSGLVHKARPSVALPLCSQRAFNSKLF